MKPARNPELEQAIIANRDDLRAWSVYADWLLAQGDPWGERISLALARATAPEARELAESAARGRELADRSAALETEQLDYLLGPLASLRELGFELEIDWEHGLLASLRVAGPRDDPTALGQFTAILASSAARLLASIQITVSDHDDHDVGPMLACLVQSGPLLALRELTVSDTCSPPPTGNQSAALGSRTDEPASSSSFVGIGDLSPLLCACPNLRSLHVRGATIQFSKPLRHPMLEQLWIEGDGLARSTFATIVAAELPNLRSLELWLGTRWIGSATTRDLLERLGHNRGLPRLTQLGLIGSKASDDIAAALPGWPLLAHLRDIDLSRGTLGDRGGQAILEHAASFVHLHRLELDQNTLSDDLAAALERVLGDHVHVGRRIVVPAEPEPEIDK